MGIQGVKTDKSKILSAIAKTRGVITHAAELVKCTPETIYLHMKEDEEVAQAVRDARAQRDIEIESDNIVLVNKARDSLHKLLDKNDVTATIFTMRTKGGFEHNMPSDSTINVNVDTRPFQSIKNKKTKELHTTK